MTIYKGTMNADTQSGTDGHDIFYMSGGNDSAFGLGGVDFMYGEDGNDTLWGGAGADGLGGGNGNDTLVGETGDDTLVGGGGDDILKGGAASDFLLGGEGNDLLIGGAGPDRLAGGPGADRFYFEFASETGPTTVDVIDDFNQAEGDKIDLSAIDACAFDFWGPFTWGNNAFLFIGNSPNNGYGSVGYYHADGKTYVHGSTDADDDAEFTFVLSGTVNLSAGDFYL